MANLGSPRRTLNPTKPRRRKHCSVTLILLVLSVVCGSFSFIILQARLELEQQAQNDDSDPVEPADDVMSTQLKDVHKKRLEMYQTLEKTRIRIERRREKNGRSRRGLKKRSNFQPSTQTESRQRLPKVPPPSDWPAASSSTTSKIIIMVLSARQNAAQRQAIRATWAHQRDNVYFVLGAPCRKLSEDELSCEDNSKENNGEEMEMLRKEQSLHRDLILTSVRESYRSLPAKLKEGLAWIVQHIPSVEWVVKADDDVYIRMPVLDYYMKQLPSNKPALVGRIKYGNYVFREGKWAEDKYIHDTYPPFSIGSCGYALSRSVAEYVSSHMNDLEEYQGEDSSLGIWLDESPLSVNFVTSSVFDNRGDCNSSHYYLVGHNLNTTAILACHDIAAEREDQPETIKWMAELALTGRDVVILPRQSRRRVQKRSVAAIMERRRSIEKGRSGERNQLLRSRFISRREKQGNTA